MQTYALHTHTHIHSNRFYFYILAILGVCLYLLFMLLLETVSFVSAGVVFVLTYSGILKAQPSYLSNSRLTQSFEMRWRTVLPMGRSH